MNSLRHRWTRDLDLPVNPWWILWVAALSVAWLLPTHLLPWRSYHAEMAMVLAILPAALWAPLYRRAPVTLSTAALVALLATSIPFGQLAAGMLHFAGDAWITAAYLFAFGLAIVTGTRIEQVEPGRTAEALFAAFAVAAVLSTGLILYQLLGVSGLGLLTVHFPHAAGYRPFANLGQSNQVATLVVWGLLGFWWLYLTGRIRGWIAAGAAAFLLVGVAATQSRTGWLEVGVLGAAAAVWRTTLAFRRAWPGLLLLGLGFVALVLSWGAVTELIEFRGVRSLGGELSSAGLRPAAWQLFVDAVGRHPLTGWGWGQISVAHTALALDHPPLRYTFQSSHNLLLDLLVQIGVPLTLVLVGSLALWIVAKCRQVTTPTGRLLLLAIGVLLVHAMLEFPLEYTFFLLPLGLMIGVLDAAQPTPGALKVPRAAVVALVTLGALATAWIGVEYRMAERSLEQVRMERNRVGFARDSRAPDLMMLTQLREFLRFLRVRYTAPATAEELEWMRRVVAHYPSDGNQLGLAVAAATNDRPDIASDALARMCRMVPPSRCDQALTTWRAMAGSSPALAAVSLPAVTLPR